jgi:hypothetical protein
MGRFLGTAAGRTKGSSGGGGGSSGGGGGGVFSNVKVFSTPGATTFDVPSSSTNVKAIVIGAGSCYRTGTYCHVSSDCCSGVAFPNKTYSVCFTGHLTGAGGAYSEKTFTSDEDVPGKTLTINVGSVGGLSASSVAGDGFTTISAANATESAHTWACTSNSTARDASNDNPVAFGFSLPVCGYANNISGYYNKGGTASGGDINRVGGDGLLIPEFLYDSCVDGIRSGGGGGASGNQSACWINPTVTCGCANRGYHTTFGGSQFGGTSFVGCYCYYLCGNITNLCACALADSNVSEYVFKGRNQKNSTYGFVGSATIDSIADGAADLFHNETPMGIGAQAGTSADDGKSGSVEKIVTEVGVSKTTGGGGGSALHMCYTYTNYGYDYSFGGSGCSYICTDVLPGCFSTCSSFTGTCGNQSWCYTCMGFAYTYYFGTAQSGTAHCFCSPYGLVHESGSTITYKRSHNLGFIQDKTANYSEEYIIPTSTLVDENDANISDIAYGNGAGITTSAGYGGGGNRKYPAAGSGVVVLLY